MLAHAAEVLSLSSQVVLSQLSEARSELILGDSKKLYVHVWICIVSWGHLSCSLDPLLFKFSISYSCAGISVIKQ